MPSYSKPEVVLVLYPFSDLTSAKVRPAIVVNAAHVSQDLFVVALTSKTRGLLAGEFVLTDWKAIGLNVETAVKRGIYTIKETLVKKHEAQTPILGQIIKARPQSDARCCAGYGRRRVR